MPKFKFSDEIMSSCTDTDDSPLRENLDNVWRKDLTRKQKREIVTALKTYAKDYVFKFRHISNLGLNCESYYRLKSLSWSTNLLMAEYRVLDIQMDDEYHYLSLDDSFEMVCPENNPLLEHPVSVSKFKKTLSSLVNRIVVKTLGKTASL